MEKRDIKRFIIVVIYFLIFVTFSLLIYFWLKPAETCFDQKMNQNEQEVDCGGVCQKKCNLLPQFDLTVGEKGFVESGISGKYDLFGEVSNPNNDFGSGSFSYEFKIKDSAGTVLNQFSGKSFILPGEKKYLVATNISAENIPGEITLAISEVKWEEFINYEKPQLKIINRNYQETSSGVSFSEAYGLLKNESPFDFSTIKINMILKNSAGKIVALNSTVLNTVKTGESRDFKAIWPNKFPGEVGDMEFQTEVNVFNSESFARRYFRSQKFQEYDY
ncbi:hypothetical protein KJ761_00545 [Patescibacteria group bacterium]|nr:hypothetical protein [Patescibacteria group bacterium]